MHYEIIYKAADSHEAHFIQGILKKYSIESKLIGENLSIGVGGLPVDVLQVDILVPNDQIKKSEIIISNYENNLSLDESKENWECTSCKEINPPSFEICWNCKE
ncbi:MAG: DUF2007 domain-containing protein [Candidatus Marinimicrobia bacterium]|nr:DUF2007 domain-containing protein [Candidatus Neomarinimicrobiota bacterium]